MYEAFILAALKSEKLEKSKCLKFCEKPWSTEWVIGISRVYENNVKYKQIHNIMNFLTRYTIWHVPNETVNASTYMPIVIIITVYFHGHIEAGELYCLLVFCCTFLQQHSKLVRFTSNFPKKRDVPKPRVCDCLAWRLDSILRAKEETLGIPHHIYKEKQYKQ